MSNTPHLNGLIAATFTPFGPDGSLDLDRIPGIVDHLCGDGVEGLYVCGSTGEGPSLSTAERRAVAAAYLEAAAERLPVIVQVGHNSLAESRGLAEHAAEAGASAISSVSPSYFKPSSTALLVESMADICSACELPFYYYHIPRLSGAECDMIDFLDRASEAIPTLAGIKYSDFKVYEYQACLEYEDGAFDILWGCDEMLLSALVVGGAAAVGSTYNFAAPIYNRLIQAFEREDLDSARGRMSEAVGLVRILAGQGVPAHVCIKAAMAFVGADCGPCRLPFPKLGPHQVQVLHDALVDYGFFDMIGAPAETHHHH